MSEALKCAPSSQAHKRGLGCSLFGGGGCGVSGFLGFGGFGGFGDSWVPFGVEGLLLQGGPIVLMASSLFLN